MRPVRPLPPGVCALLADFRARLEGTFGARLLVLRLFGSVARGEAREDSDVDVLVVVQGCTAAEARAVAELAGSLWPVHELLLSPTVLDAATYEKWRRQGRPLLRAVEEEGIPV